MTAPAVSRAESVGVAAGVLLLAAVPAAWLATWLVRGVSTPAVGGAEDFPYQAVLAIGFAAPPAVAAATAMLPRSGWEPWEAALLGAAATLAIFLGARILMQWPGWMTYVCANEGTGPHLLFRRLTTLVLLRPGGGLRGQDYGAGPALAGAAAVGAYLAGGIWALRNRRRALWAWPAAGIGAMVVWIVVFALIEGAPAFCTT